MPPQRLPIRNLAPDRADAINDIRIKGLLLLILSANAASKAAKERARFLKLSCCRWCVVDDEI